MARRRRTIGPLDLRAQAILRAVIEEYVTTATPVGSQALVDRYSLRVSSATVRNILAELELNGLLRVWKTASDTLPTSPQRAVVLVQKEEGLHGAEVRFFNSRAPAGVRPTLRVSYIPRVNFGVP